MYDNLVMERKACHKCENLKNPSSLNYGKYDSEHIGPWSSWQGNLDSDIVVVGQDWGDINYFLKWQGRDQAQNNPTNENLQILLSGLGLEIGKPTDSQNQVVFFTNLILCLKEGGLQAPVDKNWFSNCSALFFKPLINIIRPKVIIALGKKTSHSIMALYNIPYRKSESFYEIIAKSPYLIDISTVLFPVYHCGAGSVNRNRPMIRQSEDWLMIKNWITKNHQANKLF
jgi:uracil-DNA glycosylase